MKQDRSIALSPAAVWTSISAPVLTLAEEMASRRTATQRTGLWLRIRAEGLDVLEKGAAGQLVLSVPGRPQLAVHQLRERLATRLPPEVALVFAQDQSISQQIVLPLQPDDVLKAIVRNKVESLAPWPLAQCLWGMRVSPIPGDPGHVAVDVAVVSRSLMDALSAALRKGGAEVTAASVTLDSGENVAIEIGADDIRQSARRRAKRLVQGVAAALVLLFGLALFWIYRTNSEAARLEQETSAVIATLKPSGALAGETPRVAAANQLRVDRTARPPAAAVLEEISTLLPDTAHLTYLGLNGDEVVLRGQGSGVPALIGLLETSPSFDSVNFAAATELDENSKADAFSLSAKIAGAPNGAAP